MTYETFAAGILALVGGLGFFGYRMHSEAHEWHLRHMPECNEMKRKIKARFSKQVLEFVETIVTNSTHKFDNLPKSMEELQRNANQIDLAKKIEELSKVLVEDEAINENYDSIRDSRKKMAGSLFLLAVFAGANSILLFLADAPPFTSIGSVQQPVIPFIIIIMIDIFATFPIMDLQNSFRRYNKGMEWFAKKVRDDQIDVGRSLQRTLDSLES